MKRVLSFILCVIMVASVFTAAAVSVSAAAPTDVMDVTTSGVSNGKVTYDIYLKKNVSLVGAIVRVVYDPAVLKPVSGGAHASSASINGLFANGMVSGTNNTYALAFAAMNDYTVGNSNKAFMTVTFEVIGKAYQKTDVKFYCVEFNSSNANLKIEKNDTNPPLLETISTNTLGKTNYVGVYSYEKGLRVEWKATPGATGYNVYKYNGSKYMKIGSTNASKLYFDDPNVKANSSASYIVRGYNASGEDAGASPAVSGYYVKPTDKITATLQADSVKVSWTAVSGATYYQVYRRVINADGTRSGWTFLGKKDAKTLTHTDKSGLVNNTNYEYTVRAYTAKGASGVCRFSAVRFIPAPTVTAKAVTGGAKISWNAISGAKSYNIYRMYNGDKHWTYIKTVPAGTLTYTDTAVTSGRNVFYTVRAVTANGASAYKASAKLSYIGIPHITSAANVLNGVQVKWNAVPRANGYRVYRRAAGEKHWSYITTVKGTTYLDKNCKAGVYYRYTVKTVFYSMFSDCETGLLVRHIPAPKLKSIVNTGSGIQVKWQGSSAAAQYRVYRRANGEKSWSYIGATTSTQYLDKNVTAGRYYRYTVRAVNGYYSGFDGNGLLIKRK